MNTIAFNQTFPVSNLVKSQCLISQVSCLTVTIIMSQYYYSSVSQHLYIIKSKISGSDWLVRAHMLHIIELITKGESDLGAETINVKKLTDEVTHTAMLLGINIINSSYQERQKEVPIKEESGDKTPEEKVDPIVKEEVVEVAYGYKDMDLENSEYEYVEVKIEDTFKEEKIKVETGESIQFSENLKTQTSSSQEKEKHIEDILRNSREIVRSTIGPTRTGSYISNQPNESGPTNNNIPLHHPYAWWGHPIYMNPPSYGRGPDTSRGRGVGPRFRAMDRSQHWY